MLKYYNYTGELLVCVRACACVRARVSESLISDGPRGPVERTSCCHGNRRGRAEEDFGSSISRDRHAKDAWPPLSLPHAHTRAHARTRTHTHTQARTYTRRHAHTHTHTHARAHTQAHTHTHTQTHAGTHTHRHVRAHAHKHTPAHARTHTHTNRA